MKIKIDAGYRSVECGFYDGQLEYKEKPYVKADVDIDVEFLKYINSRFGEGNTELYDTLCDTLRDICLQITKGARVF
jgi:hypothetical protein